MMKYLIKIGIKSFINLILFFGLLEFMESKKIIVNWLLLLMNYF